MVNCSISPSLQYGSDVKASDPQGQTAMTMARKTGSKECADILLQHGCPNEVSPN